MVIALLILIVAILLFGAGVVKGFLANAFGAILGFSLLIALTLVAISFLGKQGFIYVLLGVAGVAILTMMVVEGAKPIVPKKPPTIDPEKPVFHSRAPSKEERKAIRRRRSR